MSIVYVVQESPGKDIVSALEFGKIDVLLPSEIQLSFETGFIVRKLRRRLATFSDDDYILALGDPAAIGTVCAIAADVNEGFFKLLKWDRIEKKYYPVKVDIFDQDESEWDEDKDDFGK